MVKSKSFQIVILIIIISVAILLYVVLFRSQGPQTAPVPVGETGKQQETTQQPPQQGEQGAGTPQEAPAEQTQKTGGERGTPEGAVTPKAAPTP